MTPKVEEFFNHFHSPKDGKFSIGGAPGRYKSGPGKGLFSIAKTSKRGPKHSLLGFKPHARQSFSTPHLEEFYNHVHDSATGRFSGRAASGRAGFREGSHGTGRQASTVIKPPAVTVRAGNVKVDGRHAGFIQKVGQYAVGRTDSQKYTAAYSTRGGAAAGVKRVGSKAEALRLVLDNHSRFKSQATPHNFPRGDGRTGATHQTGGIAKKGEALSKKWAAHRAEAARQQDLRAAKIQAAKAHTTTSAIPGLTGHTRTYGRSGQPVVGKLPLRNATTGRLNPAPVRAAFKQGTNEIIHPHKQDSKRTTFTGSKIRTSKTIAGRITGHVSSKGKAGRPKFVNPLSGVYVK